MNTYNVCATSVSVSSTTTGCETDTIMPVLGPDPNPVGISGYRWGSSFSETISFGLQWLFSLNKPVNTVY